MILMKNNKSATVLYEKVPVKPQNHLEGGRDQGNG
jgi:hypothetical protein